MQQQATNKFGNGCGSTVANNKAKSKLLRNVNNTSYAIIKMVGRVNLSGNFCFKDF
jgi:hypothetical protein